MKRMDSDVVAVLVLVTAAMASPAAVLAVSRRRSPWQALIGGALTTYAVTVLIGFAALVVWTLFGGVFIDDPDCDWTCTITAGDVFVFAVFLLVILALPIAVVGGIISALTSVMFVRPKDSDQPLSAEALAQTEKEERLLGHHAEGQPHEGPD